MASGPSAAGPWAATEVAWASREGTGAESDFAAFADLRGATWSVVVEITVLESSPESNPFCRPSQSHTAPATRSPPALPHEVQLRVTRHDFRRFRCGQ